MMNDCLTRNERKRYDFRTFNLEINDNSRHVLLLIVSSKGNYLSLEIDWNERMLHISSQPQITDYQTGLHGESEIHNFLLPEEVDPQGAFILNETQKAYVILGKNNLAYHRTYY